MKTVKHLLAFLMIILLSVFLCSCSQSAKAHAEKAIKKDLDLLKNLDSETTMQYISYQELFPDSDDSTKLSADIKEVFSSPHMSPKKMIGLSSAAAAAKGYEVLR